jgi:TolB-like protein/Tfp pilus assembly protein PilF
MTFLAELRKRKVFQVAIGYLAVAWLLVQVTATILPAFDLPIWTLRLVVLLFALGFPVALLMAWSLELTPDGVKLDVGTTAGKGMLAVAAALMAVALGWFFHGLVLPAPHAAQGAATSATATPAPRKLDARSIAVLPLVNASNDPDQQFFSDGLSENLINSLSRYDGLKVIGRISAFQFRDSKDDSATIGRKLGVAYLLNGSVQRAVDVVRISVSLTNAADGSTLWAEHYDRPYKDLFALQDEIAQSVANVLQARLLPGIAARQSDRPPSGNMDAYAAYLRAMQFFYQGASLEEIKYQTLATHLDPAYAAAWAHLSVAWARLGFNGSGEEAQDAYRQARFAADKALALAPDLGLAHAVRGNLLLGADFDWQGALAEFRRGVELAPEIGAIHSGYSRALAATGRLQTAIVEKRLALSIDPRMVPERFRYVDLLIAAGRLDEAEKEVKAGIELSGYTSSQPYYRLRFALLRGDAKAAQEAATQTSTDVRDLSLALAAQIGHDRMAADAALAKLFRDHDDLGARQPYELASLYALRGEVDKTVESLDRTWANRDIAIHQVLYDPVMLRFRDEPKFIAFCKKIGLPPPSDSEALSIDQIRAL